MQTPIHNVYSWSLYNYQKVKQPICLLMGKEIHKPWYIYIHTMKYYYSAIKGMTRQHTQLGWIPKAK